MQDEFLNTDFYEFLLLDPLTKVYSAVDRYLLAKWEKYAFLLIDKFAIHSSSFFHLSKGIIEHRKSGKTIKAYGYDIFTVNSTFRTIIETYATFNHIYVAPKTKEEQKFKYLLWRIDGLNEKQKYNFQGTNNIGINEILENDRVKLEQAKIEAENSNFYKNCDSRELLKIYDLKKNKFCWKFQIESGKIKPMTIMSLIEHTCRTNGFINSYRYSSTHTHSSYLSIEEFERYRGNPIPDSYVSPLIKLAIFITSMIIYDICIINKQARETFKTLPFEVQKFINGITESIKTDSH
ncbi:MAG: hypothetical protein LBQ22_11570 [Bacteroidales bacterium]|jgi:hypothetical protein|nr:hypothetical protein [Bacteroidales bacterium]